jgi:hypothetical protein
MRYLVIGNYTREKLMRRYAELKEGKRERFWEPRNATLITGGDLVESSLDWFCVLDTDGDPEEAIVDIGVLGEVKIHQVKKCKPGCTYTPDMVVKPLVEEEG